MSVASNLLTLLFVGLGILVAGIVIVFVAAALGSGSASAGGVIFIGPFPIAFGVGPDAAWLIIVSLVIAVLMIVLFYVLRRKSWAA
jgi:uncharacterized membrane protein